ncbi:MAG: palindromic element RPE3 domain-containing protein [Rickettsia endosymbiont of Ecitomorpha arachnoides]|nr:palindromic element RPE3 domain-containing protein [Rickettsia endosymbiont of Ecitomorpha arachnoides]
MCKLRFSNKLLQLNSEDFRQDEFKSKPAERTEVREQRLGSRNSLVSSFLNDAVPSLYAKDTSLNIISPLEIFNSVAFSLSMLSCGVCMIVKAERNAATSSKKSLTLIVACQEFSANKQVSDIIKAISPILISPRLRK